MNFYSTNQLAPITGLHEAVFNGTAPDKGLYMPEKIPQLSQHFFENIQRLSLHEIAFELSKIFFGNDFNNNILLKIVEETLNFDIPLIKVHDNIYSLELFHGPTLAFKDVGARFMARVCQQLLKKEEKKLLNILVATSGDTGSAVANGFLGIEGINVTVLYPKGRVSEIQEKQFTTLGKNITALEVDGSFDDCQALVKKAFNDVSLRQKVAISSANSINLARLLPQSFYYFHAYAQFKKLEPGNYPIVFSVPSGNFGNLTAGLIAQKMGLPVKQFIAATNINDVVPEYILTDIFRPRPSVSTLSNAMDVGNPSNFIRVLDLFSHNYQAIKKNITGDVYTDKEVLACIEEVYKKHHYTLDPHGTIGYLALQKYLKEHSNASGIFIETAHPAKFKETVEKAIGKSIKIPQRLSAFLSKPKKSIALENDYSAFKELLINSFEK